MSAVATEEHIDGRAARRLDTRAKIIAAFVDLITEVDGADPTSHDIADRAGIGLRTFFQHFPRTGDVYPAAGYRRTVKFVELVDLSAERPS